ncbi:glycosyltransferase [Candidatus Woesearchaeota archaeon]|nr:glycosyltransferase [Candidatus Woesearchaeota archaeon]
MEEPLISIIIPAYNERDYIAEALKSAQRQTYDRLETIVVANACSDDTVKVAREFATTVLEVPEQGISFAKNIGFQNSKGYICSFMDADSQMEENLLEAVYDSLKKGYDCGKAKIRSLDDKRLRAKIFSLYSELLSRLTSVWSWIDSGAGAFTYLTKELAQKVQNPDGTLYRTDLQVMEDVDLLTRMKKKGKYRFITESCLYTSMRRFKEEGYIKCFIEDSIHVLNPKGKTRKRWK